MSLKTAEKIAKAESKKIAKICKACGGADADCDDLVVPVNLLTSTLGGSGGTGAAADFTPAAIGFPATCDVATVPHGGPVCDGPVTTLAELIFCVDCVAEFTVDCVDAARVPEPLGGSYPGERVP